MICFPNCKINIGLNIIEKRNDGFHNIETVFYPVNLTDALEIIKTDSKTEFSISGIEIADDSNNNLCLKVYNFLKEKYNLPEIKIHLHKNIPVGAGLGGGSSDCTYTVKLLNNIFNLKLSNKEIIDIVSVFGSDCAFFVDNKPVFGKEKGNVFENIELNLSKYYIAIVKPNIHISTVEAYKSIKPVKPEVSLKTIIKYPVNEWKDYLKNDFEDGIFSKYPKIFEIKQKLYNIGAVYSSMSGSGSSVFGIFENEIYLEQYFNNEFLWFGKMQ